MDKVVDVLLDGELLISYPISLRHMNMPISDADFVAEAKASLREDDYSESAISEAMFRVRDP